jgi:hypothetical protein
MVLDHNGSVAEFLPALARAECGCIGIWLNHEKELMLVLDQCDDDPLYGETLTFQVREVKKAGSKPVREDVANGIYTLMQTHIWQATKYRQIRDALHLGIVE